MLRACIALLITMVVAGCGHSQINYTPSPNRVTSWERAVSVIERGFYEDYGDQKVQAVQVTDEAIVLADGNITTSSHAGTAVPVYGAAVLVGSTTSKTVSAGQRIYINSLMPAMVMKKNLRDNRYAVIIRQEPGFTARRVYFRSQALAQEFADALAFLRQASR